MIKKMKYLIYSIILINTNIYAESIYFSAITPSSEITNQHYDFYSIKNQNLYNNKTINELGWENFDKIRLQRLNLGETNPVTMKKLTDKLKIYFDKKFAIIKKQIDKKLEEKFLAEKNFISNKLFKIQNKIIILNKKLDMLYNFTKNDIKANFDTANLISNLELKLKEINNNIQDLLDKNIIQDPNLFKLYKQEINLIRSKIKNLYKNNINTNENNTIINNNNINNNINKPKFIQ